MTLAESAPRENAPAASSGAPRVAAGIVASRVLGLAREAVIAAVAGVGALTDILAIAFRAPNVLQNLLGDQALSASFIPVYSRLLADGRRREAGALAGAAFGLLFAAMAVLSLLGVLLAPWIVRVLVPGLAGDAELVAAGAMTVDRLKLATAAVRICFPMVGAIVLSAWCLGVLNSHRRFLLPYLAPCFWNASVIAAVLVVAGRTGGDGVDRVEALAMAVCWGGLAGGLLQFAVQLPLVLRVAGGLRPSLALRAPGVRTTLTNLGPAVAARGVGQLGAWVDLFLASFLVEGAFAALTWGQRLYLLPISLFAVSVAAAELPELSRLRGQGEERARAAAERARRSLAAMSFLVAPTTVGYLLLGFGIVGAIYRRGAFGLADNGLVFLVLAAYSLGLLASSASRLLQSVFFSLGDTRSPARIAAMRLVLAAGAGAVLMMLLDRFAVGEALPWLDLAPADAQALRLGAVGLALASAAGSWLELGLLLGRLRRKNVAVPAPWRAWLRHLALGAACAAPWAATQIFVPGPPWLAGTLPVAGFAATYLAAAYLLKAPEALALWRWLSETRRRREP